MPQLIELTSFFSVKRDLEAAQITNVREEVLLISKAL